MNHFAKVWGKLEGYLRQGQEPKTLAATITLGMLLGLFPIIGTTTLLCALVSIPFRLNMVVIQLANYLVYPLQLIILIPLIKLGGYLFGAPPIPNIEHIVKKGFMALEIIGINCLYGVVVWLVLSIPAFFILYFLLVRIFQKRVSGG